MQETQKTVVVCPMDWGLGHATRMVPVIELMMQAGARVIIAADKRPLAFLKQRFPECIFEQLSGFSPKYPRLGALMPFVMATNLPKMLFQARRARIHLKDIIRKHRVEVVISDNRYELHSTGVYSVFVTHQLHIQTRGWQRLFDPLISKIINHYFVKFNELWIPDTAETPDLGGILSHPAVNLPVKQTYIGLLTRFSQQKTKSLKTGYELVILLSGPEPQRTLLEKNMMQQALSLNVNAVIVQGKPEMEEDVQHHHLRVVSHADDQTLASFIYGAELVVCRPGYSTLMDLTVLQKKVAFIPTPGQTEQEYLARKLFAEGRAYYDTQDHFNLKTAFETRERFIGLSGFKQENSLQVAIDRLLGQDLPKSTALDEGT